MFLGEYQHSLDAKGRVILPSEVRAGLTDGCVLTKGQERCLYVFPPEEFARVSERLSEGAQSSRQVRDFLRMWYSGSAKEVPDKQGRINIPEPLRTYAHLEREVLVLGVGERVEIWNRQEWEARRGATEEAYSNLEPDPDLPF